MVCTYAIAHAAATDAGNESMRRNSRSRWNVDDYNACAFTFARLRPDGPPETRSTATPTSDRAPVREVWMSRGEAAAFMRRWCHRNRLPKRGNHVQIAEGVTLSNDKGKYHLVDVTEAGHGAQARKRAMIDRRDRRIDLAIKLLRAASEECGELGDDYRNSNMVIKSALQSLDASYGTELSTLVQLAIRKGELTADEVLSMAVDAADDEAAQAASAGNWHAMNKAASLAHRLDTARRRLA